MYPRPLEPPAQTNPNSHLNSADIITTDTPALRDVPALSTVACQVKAKEEPDEIYWKVGCF